MLEFLKKYKLLLAISVPSLLAVIVVLSIFTGSNLYGFTNPQVQSGGSATLDPFTGNIVPTNNATQNIGSTSKRINNLWATNVTTTSLYVNGTAITGAATVAWNAVDDNIIPDTNNAYNLGMPTSSFANVYASGTAYIPAFKANAGSLASPSFSFSNDPNTGIYSYGGDIVGISVGGGLAMALGTTGISVAKNFIPTANNSFNLGSQTLSWGSLFASSTSLLRYVTSTAMTVTGNFYTGGIQFTDDAGFPALANLNITSAVGGTKEGYSLQIEGENYLFPSCNSNGAGGCYSTSTFVIAGKSIRPDMALNNAIDLGATYSAWRSIYASSTLRIGGSTATTTVNFTTSGTLPTCHVDSAKGGSTLYWYWSATGQMVTTTNSTECL
jgi:hypothetical protein